MRDPYHRPVIAADILPYLAIGLAVAFAALWPAARLGAAGWSRTVVVGYYGLLIGLAIAAFVLRAGLRLLVPALVVIYVAPFVLIRIRRAPRP